MFFATAVAAFFVNIILLIFANIALTGDSAFELAVLSLVNMMFGVQGDGGGFYLSSDSHPQIISSILWANYPNSLYLNEGDEFPYILYSNIQGGWIGEGNINVSLYLRKKISHFLRHYLFYVIHFF